VLVYNGEKMSNQAAIENGSYMKPNKNFKFPKGMRIFMQSISNSVDRHTFKNQLIQATLAGNRLPEKKKKPDASGKITVAI
jgi:hypothetical protein